MSRNYAYFSLIMLSKEKNKKNLYPKGRGERK